MPAVDVQKAIKINRIYARTLNWSEKFNQLIQVLGFTDRTPGEGLFAEAVAAWQAKHPPLKVDGMLGPRTWGKLEDHTHFTPRFSFPKPEWTQQPLPSRTDPEVDAIRSNIWLGIGVNYGGHFFAIGKNSGHAWLISADDYQKQCLVTIENWRLGPGLGGSWSAALFMIASMHHPTQLNREVSSGWDIQIGLGARWGEVLKKIHSFPQVAKIVDRLKNSDDVAKAMNNPAAKKLLQMPMKDWMAIKGRVKELISATDMKTDDYKPNIATIGIPVPYSALELSGYWQFGDYRVEHYWGMQPIARGLG